MACEQAVVTLTPVYSPDSLPFRSLTFSSNNDTVPIGRASKSETKNLVPGHDNGWFDSRVMSREHGVISVSLENKAVYIRDHGSLHGTQLNDATITPKQNVAVKSGDVLTFGSEISRGTQTFRPIAVRLDCQWHEKRIAPATTKPTVNTFCVPDEEDDVVEVVHYKEVTVQQKASQCASDSSDLDYGSDMSRPLDLTSPVTSPEIKTSQLPNQLPVETNNATGVQQTSSEAVIPPSSPPAQSEDEDQPESEEEDDGSESDDSAGEETNDFFEGGSEASEDDHYEGSDWDEQESALADAQAPPFSVFQGSMARPFATLDANAEEINLPTHENQATSQIPNQSDVTNQTRDSTSVVQEQSLISTTLPQQGFTLPEYAIPRIPSPSDKAMAKPLGIPAPAPAYNPYSISPALQAWARGKHLPSSSTLNNTMGLTNSFESTNANESFPFGPHRSSGYLRNLANGAPESQPIWSQDLKSRRSNIEKLRALTKVENPVNKPTTRVSVSKIVEANIQNHPSTTKNLKRKVDEYMADLDDDSKETGNTQDSITDAQPRPDMQNLELTQSQTAKTQSIPEVGPSSPKESRRKRVKTHQVYTFMKYAAIAAVGAAVGSIGTIAGLSSLPADYFN